MLSTKAFARGLEDFETAYNRCLNTLVTLTAGDPPSEDLARFQPLLYHALLQLSRAYHEIRRERERLISRKRHLAKKWYDRRQRTLAERQQIIMRAIRLGRTLGDAFGWFFTATIRHSCKSTPANRRLRVVAVKRLSSIRDDFSSPIPMIRCPPAGYHGVAAAGTPRQIRQADGPDQSGRRKCRSSASLEDGHSRGGHGLRWRAQRHISHDPLDPLETRVETRIEYAECSHL
jgi:hypothetical protein